MNYWGIQRRILLITLLPCLITTGALGAYFIYDRHEQAQLQFNSQSTLIAKQVALHMAPELGKDSSHQKAVLEQHMALPDIRALAILSPDQQPVLHIGPNMLESVDSRYIEEEVHRSHTQETLRIKAPIYGIQDQVHSKLIGWVELEFQSHGLELQQFKGLFTGILLVIGFGILAIYLSYRSSARITKPLQHVAEALEELEAGNLEARIQFSQQAEFNELAAGINAMAASLERAQQELQDNIEQATEDLKETLEEMEVQNIELSIARRSALDASKTKSEFLANMSHEIRTPLNGIIGFTKLLEKTRLNKRQQDYLNTIEASSSSLLSIINDILDFSKIEAGKLVLDSVPVHLRDITDEVLTMLAPEAHKKGIELAALVYQDVPFEIMADSVRLKQVLTNLVNNAVKFTDSGSVIIRIMLEEELSDKVALKFTVTDTGIGLTEKQQENLFHAFNQADASTTRRFGGTGLGLVISQHLVDHMHGEIGVNSQAGMGSEFWFTAQFNTCDVAAESWEDTPWFNKVAYVRSNWDTSCQILLNQLSNLGYQVKQFNSLDELRKHNLMAPADLCFVDVQSEQDKALIPHLQQRSEVVAILKNNELQNWQTMDELNIEHNLVYPISFRRLIQLSQDLFLEASEHPMNVLAASEIKVLAVDDNEPNLELLSTWLQDLQVQVVKAHGGLQAVQLGTAQSFDLIFMDIQMPDLDGVQATQQIREQGLNKHTPLVALTAHALPSERKQLLQSGFDDYLTKPLSEDQLIHTLMKWTSFDRRNSQPIKKETEGLDLDISTDILDWQQCMKLAGGKTQLAQTMLKGLLDECEQLHPVLLNLPADQLREPVHKLHGLCKYVGAPTLLNALEVAENCLITDCADWVEKRNLLIQAIKELQDCYAAQTKPQSEISV
jgi:two-component system sensor histidine kinase BarA